MSDAPSAGMTELQAALQEAKTASLPLAAQAMGQALLAIQEILAFVPPQPSRTRAKTFNTYVREIGNFPKSSFVQDSSGAWVRKQKGAYKPGPRGGKVRYTSQKMAKRFRTTVDTQGTTVTGILENTASYSGYVIGQEQAPFHEETGWPEQDTALAEVEPQINAYFDKALDQVVNRIAQA